MKKTQKSELKTSSKRSPQVKRKIFQSGLCMILDHDELLRIEKKQKHIFGLALYIGTSTISVSLCDLERASELASASVFNSQLLIAKTLRQRIEFSKKNKNNRFIMRQSLIRSVNEAIRSCLRRSGVNKQRVFAAVAVMPACMQQLLLGSDWGNSEYKLKAGSLNMAINPDANVIIAPAQSEELGADLSMSLMNLKIGKNKKVNVGVELGSDGKIFISNSRGRIVATNISSGVFEGERISSGVIAKSGAIEWLRIEKSKIKILSIGHIRPVGICGAGIIDLVSELIKSRVIEPDGRMIQESFLIYKDKRGSLEFTRDDLRTFQLDKAVVSATLKAMMKSMRISIKDINRVYVLGALGGYLNPENLIRIGMLPPQFKGKLSYCGNRAFLGAKQALLSERSFKQAMSMAGSIKHKQIKQNKSFEKDFISALAFST